MKMSIRHVKQCFCFAHRDCFQSYVSQHGGYCNAWTSMENTQYYFEITADHLSGALDRCAADVHSRELTSSVLLRLAFCFGRFAQFFLSPLFTPSATGREMKAVDSGMQSF